MWHLNRRKLALAVTQAVVAIAALTEVAVAQTGIEQTTVVVTGEKIGRTLAETLSSVSVTTEEELETRVDTDLHDIFLRTPGVFATEGNNTFSIRGIPFDGLGSGAGSSHVISVYVDDTLQTRRNMTFAPSSTWDLNQVEIYRGSQSLVQGRNALAGTVILRSNDPTYENEGAVRLNAGLHDELGGAAVVSGGLIDQVLAARLSVDYQEDSGYIENIYLNLPANAAQSLNARGKLLFQPNPNLDVLLTLLHSDYETGNQTVNSIDGEPQFYEVATNADAVDAVRTNSVTNKVDFRLNENWTLTSISAISDVDYDAVLDFFNDADPELDDTAIRFEDEELASQELRAVFEGESVDAIMGLYYFESTLDRWETLPAFEIVNVFDISTESAAAFGEVIWKMTPEIELIGGLRYDWESYSNQAIYSGETDPLIESDVDALLPKIALRYAFTDNQSLGFSVQQGYRAGGAAFNLANQDLVEYDPEYTNNYELAYRGAWQDNRLQVMANIYRIDWTDQQVTFRTDPTDENSEQVENAGESRLKGGELMVTYFVTPVVELYSGLAYNDAEYKEFATGSQDFSGYAFERAPLWSGNVGTTVRLENGFTFNLGAFYLGETNSVYLTGDEQLVNPVSEVLATDAVTLVNASASYQVGQWQLTAYTKNLLDKQYLTNNQEGNTDDVGAPRTAGVAVRYDF